MPMAPHSSLLLGLFLLALLAASARASPTRDETPSELAEDKFLRACCANTTDPAVCYDSLFPRASSFEGNHVKVTTAATIIAYEQLRSFDAELRSLLRGGTGAGELVDRALVSCVTYFEKAVLIKEDEALATLLRLETVDGRKTKHAKSDLDDVRDRVSNVLSSSGLLCMEGFVRHGNLESPVGKKMVAGNATVTLYGAIALYLVASIKL
nr:unnamed protein product [Digitaria exilis]